MRLKHKPSLILRLFLFCVLLMPSFSPAQNYLVLKHRVKSDKQKTLSLNVLYTIVTLQETYYSDIIGIKDSFLLLPIYKNTSDTIVTIKRYRNPAANDTIISYKTKPDTLRIPVADIICLKKPLLKNRRWAEPFLFIGMGASLSFAVLTPMILIKEGLHDGLQVAAISLGVMAICAPVFYICLKEITYDLKHTWQIAH